jgi:hypothetical protein
MEPNQAKWELRKRTKEFAGTIVRLRRLVPNYKLTGPDSILAFQFFSFKRFEKVLRQLFSFSVFQRFDA